MLSPEMWADPALAERLASSNLQSWADEVQLTAFEEPVDVRRITVGASHGGAATIMAGLHWDGSGI